MPTIDHELLLRKYIDHVGQAEGIDFTDRLNDPLESDVHFNEAEVQELLRISRSLSRQ